MALRGPANGNGNGNGSGSEITAEKLLRFDRLGRLAVDLYERGREEIRRRTRSGENTGFVIVKRDEERLSKRAFEDTYGRLEAERMFAKWRRDGALVKRPTERLELEK
jgi:hypothetical protein